MQKTTSELIETYLASYPQATVSDISKALNITKADVRYHINILEKQKRIISTFPTDINKKPGRPARRYSIKTESMPDNYGEILNLILQADDFPEKLLVQAANLLTKEFHGINNTASIISRMNGLVQFLNRREYHCKWESHSSGPKIIIHNCPYHHLLKKHPYFCKMDQTMIENILERKSFHEQSFGTDNSTSCCFSVIVGVKD